MEKICTKCKKVKPYSEYSKTKYSKTGYASQCKACKRANAKVWRSNLTKEQKQERNRKEYSKYKDKIKEWKDSKKDGLHHVYILPKENYAGVTNCIHFRMHGHKSNYKRFVDDVRIIFSTKDREEALELEALLHTIGYEGKHAFNMYR